MLISCQFNMINRWSGDNGNDAFTESLCCWESGEKQVVKWTAEGAVKSVHLFTPSILQRVGIRQLPGICWYPAKRIGAILWIKVAPRIVSYSIYLYVIRPWQIVVFCQGRFLFSKSLAQNKNQGSFPILRGGEYHVINQTMASNGGAEVTVRIKDT